MKKSIKLTTASKKNEVVICVEYTISAVQIYDCLPGLENCSVLRKDSISVEIDGTIYGNGFYFGIVPYNEWCKQTKTIPQEFNECNIEVVLRLRSRNDSRIYIIPLDEANTDILLKTILEIKAAEKVEKAEILKTCYDSEKRDHEKIMNEQREEAKSILDNVKNGANIMTTEEANAFKNRWNDTYNEGADGYIPPVITDKMVEWAKNVIFPQEPTLLNQVFAL